MIFLLQNKTLNVFIVCKGISNTGSDSSVIITGFREIPPIDQISVSSGDSKFLESDISDAPANVWEAPAIYGRPPSLNNSRADVTESSTLSSKTFTRITPLSNRRNSRRASRRTITPSPPANYIASTTLSDQSESSSSFSLLKSDSQVCESDITSPESSSKSSEGSDSEHHSSGNRNARRKARIEARLNERRQKRLENRRASRRVPESPTPEPMTSAANEQFFETIGNLFKAIKIPKNSCLNSIFFRY